MGLCRTAAPCVSKMPSCVGVSAPHYAVALRAGSDGHCSVSAGRSRWHRGSNAFWSVQISSQAFSTLLANPPFAEVTLTLSKRLVSKITLKVLGFSKRRTFSEFCRIVIQDGTSFAMHDALQMVFPECFKVVKPTAAGLHTMLDLLCDAPTTVILIPHIANEQAFLLKPETLDPYLLLADRGDINLYYLLRVV